MNRRYDLDELAARRLMGRLTAEEERELQERIDGDPVLKEQWERLAGQTDFVRRYRQYAAVDKEKAKATFMKRYGSGGRMSDIGVHTRKSTMHLWMRRAAGFAAAAAVIAAVWLIAGGIGGRHNPEIAPEVAEAIDRVEKSGMNGATLLIRGSKAVNVADAAMAQAATKDRTEETGETQGTEEPVGTLVTRHDKEFWMVLDDGTYVHLNYNSSLTYPLHFTGEERRVALNGEAYFIVARDSRHPFVVSTPCGDVTDYGTEFNVNTKAEGGATSVVLVSGRVGVASGGQAERMLSPGDMAVITAGKAPEVSKVDIAQYVAWNTGNFYFDGCRLDVLMSVIARWYGMKAVFASDGAREMLFTGNIDKYESILPTIHAIENVTGLDLRLSGDSIMIDQRQ